MFDLRSEHYDLIFISHNLRTQDYQLITLAFSSTKITSLTCLFFSCDIVQLL
ncbi:hypothetical protein DFP82_1162 [Psychrobacter fozii]|uniref:Uncharacterized protein n=1 Tax=Psychrobacter fozii TaxID=198480 RepID=A0A2V4U8E5_9GAMM|nr:hypothetical protein DFP82_1162 [Psychrobacter fozii]